MAKHSMRGWVSYLDKPAQAAAAPAPASPLDAATTEFFQYVQSDVRQRTDETRPPLLSP